MIRFLNRSINSAVVWSWAFNGLRFGSALLLLPLLLRALTKADLGMHYLFLSFAALGPLLDLGFLTAIDRAVGYAMGGAPDLKAQGLMTNESQKSTPTPNLKLLWELLSTTRSLYGILSVLLLIVLSLSGTFVVAYKVAETSSPARTWLAWGVTLFSAVLELYSGWWSVFLRAMDRPLQSMKILVFSYAFRITAAAGILMMGGGLLSLPLAAFLSSILVRQASRRAVLRLMGERPSEPTPRERSMTLLKTLWPNSWRTGVQLLSTYLVTSANSFVCLKFFGLNGNAQYGLSVQVVNTIVAMAIVWSGVKWPRISRLQAQGAREEIRKVFRRSIWLQILTYAALAMLLVPALPWLFKLIGSDKTTVPLPWMVLLAVVSFFESHFITWCTLLHTENRQPYIRAIIVSNLLCLALTLVLLSSTKLGMGSLILSPLIVGAVFNYWHWPREGASRFGMTWAAFMSGAISSDSQGNLLRPKTNRAENPAG
jgi:O-antigen/teichoic acid export membrane protein